MNTKRETSHNDCYLTVIIKELSSLLIIIALIVPANGLAAENSEPGFSEHLYEKFQEHPVGYSMIGVGGLFTFLSFGGLFAGGINAGSYCKKEDNLKTGETEEDCKDRISDDNASFYRTMGIVFLSSTAVTAAGFAIVFWEDEKTEVRIEKTNSESYLALSYSF